MVKTLRERQSKTTALLKTAAGRTFENPKKTNRKKRKNRKQRETIENPYANLENPKKNLRKHLEHLDKS